MNKFCLHPFYLFIPVFKAAGKKVSPVEGLLYVLQQIKKIKFLHMAVTWNILLWHTLWDSTSLEILQRTEKQFWKK